MITLRKATERQHSRRGKTDTWLTFESTAGHEGFAGGFGALESLSECRLGAGASNPRRSDQHAEIILYVRQGAVAYNNSLGHSGVIVAGEFHRLTSGNGISHSESNASRTETAQVFEMRLRGDGDQVEPSHEQRRFSVAERRGGLRVVASPDARKGSLRIHQDTLICSAVLDHGRHLAHELDPTRMAWLHLIQGEISLDDAVMTTGDGAGVSAERAVSLIARAEAEILLIEVAS